jgi:cytosine/adenosine deaminase-related metal-dependent hydrolase
MPDACLVRGRWVVTGPAETDPVLADGAVLVREGRVAETGAWAELRDAHPGLAVLGSPGVAVLPGFIAAHHHGNAATAIQQGIGDDLLELWLLAMRAARGPDPELRALLTAARLLRSGVTAAIEMTELRSAPAPAAASLERRIGAYERSGIRMAVAVGVVSRGSLVPEPEADAFLRSLPADARSVAQAVIATPPPMDDEDYLGIVADARASLADHPHVDVWYGPPGPQWVSDALLRRVAEASEAGGGRIQVHVAESLAEKLIGPRHHGRPIVHHLRDLGILSPRCSLAHGVWLADEEIALLAESGAGVSHNPSSNLRLRAGIGPLRALLDAGVTVGLGLDANGLADDDDLFAELRLALRLGRDPRVAERVPTLADVYGAATTGGARILGRTADLGRIAPGFRADLVLVDLARATWPWVAPEADPRALVLLRAHADDVRTVLVDGEVVLDDGLPTRFDLPAAVAESVAQLDASSVDPSTRHLIEVLRPHLATFLGAWELPPLEPRVTYSSRR